MRAIVKKIRRDVEQILAHNPGRNLVAQNVAKQFEDGEHERQHQHCGQDQREIHHEIAEDEVVENHGKAEAEDAGAGGSALEGVFHGCGGNEESAAADSCLEGSPTAFEGGDFEGTLLGTPQQEYSRDETYDIRQPDAEGGRDSSLPRERDSGQRHEVVREDQDDG